METKNFKILETETPANEENLESLYSDGWVLQEILPYNDKLYYYFMKINI